MSKKSRVEKERDTWLEQFHEKLAEMGVQTDKIVGNIASDGYYKGLTPQRAAEIIYERATGRKYNAEEQGL